MGWAAIAAESARRCLRMMWQHESGLPAFG